MSTKLRRMKWVGCYWLWGRGVGFFSCFEGLFAAANARGEQPLLIIGIFEFLRVAMNRVSTIY